MPDKPTFYMSYNEHDQVIAFDLHRELIVHDNDVYYYREPSSYEYTPDEYIQKEIKRELSRRDIVLVILTPGAINSPSPRMLKEIDLALEMGKHIIPVIADDFDFEMALLTPFATLKKYRGISYDPADPTNSFMAISRLEELAISADSAPSIHNDPQQDTNAGTDIQQRIGTISGGNVTIIGVQSNTGTPPPAQTPPLVTPPTPPAPSASPTQGGSGMNPQVIIALIAAIGAIIVALIGIVPNLLSSTPTAAPTPTLTLTAAPTDTPAASTPAPASATIAASVVPSAVPMTDSAPAVTPLAPSFTVFRDEDSLTLFIPGNQPVSLVDWGFEVTVNGATTTHRLAAFPAFGIPFERVQPPICFRLERDNSARVLPQDCPAQTTLIQALSDADVFWYDDTANTARTFNITRGVETLGMCGAGQARCEASS